MPKTPSKKELTFFETPALFRSWLEKNHEKETELWVGFYKKDSNKPSMSWPDSVDEALCFGWIDGIRKSVDGESYCIRFTPRKPRSIWSTVNIEKVGALKEKQLMRPAGLLAFEARSDVRSAVYSYEQGSEASLDEASLAIFRANKKAWEYFQSQPAGYQKTASWWVVSAKKPETKQKRLATLIEDSANGRTIKSLTRPEAKKPGSM
jgi:uncharacterized protein YdeI (YjbR/CyaY-like superfamily)